jgi:hypothetical protein
VEALAQAPDTRAALQALAPIQAAWKSAGSLPRPLSAELGTRYKAALDAVYSRHRERRAQIDGERAERLARLNRLVEQAEAMAARIPPEQAPAAARSLMAQWKQIGHAGSRAEMDLLWQRFRAACDHMFERREAARSEQLEFHRQRKQALIARARQLAEAGVADPDAAIEALILEWKKVGPVPRAEAEALWQSFRDALTQLRQPAWDAGPQAERPLSFQPFAGLDNPRGQGSS